MNPEIPFLAAGAIAIIGGTRREGHFPNKGLEGVIATVVLVIFASATKGTKIAPLVHAVGLLLLMAAVFAATKDFQIKGKIK